MVLKLRPKNSEEVYSFYKEARPKMDKRGSTWDCMTVEVDGKDCKFWYDTTWGWYYHVEWQGVWYKHPIIFKRNHPKTGKCIDLENFVGYRSEFEQVI